MTTMDILGSFDTLFENTTGESDHRRERTTYFKGQREGDPRLDFFSHIFKRLETSTPMELRSAPLIYGNHVEYTQTFFPLVIEDTIANLPDRMEGGIRLMCSHLNRWCPPFNIAFCECPRETSIHGNELVCVEDGRGRKTWGITKRGPRVELTGEHSIEVLLSQHNRDISLGTWICYVLVDLNSHMREYIAVQSVPRSNLMSELIGCNLKKQKHRKKKTDVVEHVFEGEDLIQDLNGSQQNAVRTALTKKDGIVLIQGPPGTGKTKTVVTLLRAYLSSSVHRRGGILVCAPSNTAVDELTLRLIEVLRGSSARVIRVCAHGKGDNCKEVLLQNVASVSNNKVTQALRTTDQQAIVSGAEDEARSGWHSFEIDALLDKRDALRVACQRTEWSSKKDAVAQADIVLCTLSMAASSGIATSMARFETVVIDEAAQAVEPSTLIPLSYGANRLILVGDACQLPATVKSNTALRHGYGRSMFERLQDAGTTVCLLNTQYRMNQQIRSFPARYFYDDHLKDGIIHEPMPHHEKWYFGPYAFFNIEWGTEMQKGTSICNDAEAHFLSVLLRHLHQTYPSVGQSTAVLTPYRAQVERIKQELSHNHYQDRHAVEVGTVDGFQGREANVVILSSVRTSTEDVENATIGFLNDRRRMNVALTRARHSLWVVGNKSMLRVNSDWEELIKDVERRGFLFNVTWRDNHFEIVDPASDRSVSLLG